MIVEFCIDTVDGAIAAQKYGAKRVELCSALGVGGLTPSLGLIKQCKMASTVEVHVMLRHIEGGFNYNESDVQIMLKDISGVKAAEADGVVFGCLTTDDNVDIEKNQQILELTKEWGLTTTFHRAFDFCNDPFSALEQIIDLGFDRILTSGQQNTAIEGVDLIRELVQKADGRIEIMAGSGVNSSNAIQLSETGVNALHFTIHQKNTTSENLGMGNRTVIDKEKITSIIQLFK